MDDFSHELFEFFNVIMQVAYFCFKFFFFVSQDTSVITNIVSVRFSVSLISARNHVL
jgi:hypothetical protein